MNQPVNDMQMNTLVFQVVIKQWDKSQRSKADSLARSKLLDRYSIKNKPEFLILGQHCIIDQYCLGITGGKTITRENRPLNKSILDDGNIKFERFIISASKDINSGISIHYQSEDGQTSNIADINKETGWIQAKYNWRYRTEEKDQIFWQYEELTLNVILVNTLDSECFINSLPENTFTL